MNPDMIHLGGKELINADRTLSYIGTHLPQLEVKCEVPSSTRLANVPAYSTPQRDQAPWITQDIRSHHFYGMLVSDVEGLWDSTQTVDVVDLVGDGAVPGYRRNARREIKITATLYARDRDSLNYGIDWLVTALSGGYCPAYGVPYCEGETLTTYTLPDRLLSTTQWHNWVEPRIRHIHDVKTLQGVVVKEDMGYRTADARTVEFILVAGNPFVYSGPVVTRTVQNPTWSTRQEVKCNPEDEVYDSLITDPQGGIVVRPPRPPLIEPITMPTSWRSASQTFPLETVDRPGQMVWRIAVSNSGADIRLLRVRFYRPGAAECDYSGEFVVTYLPRNFTLIIDGVNRTARAVRPDGTTTPASNLIIGSDGRPAEWPVLDCRQPVTMRVDHPSTSSTLKVEATAINRR